MIVVVILMVEVATVVVKKYLNLFTVLMMICVSPPSIPQSSNSISLYTYEFQYRDHRLITHKPTPEIIFSTIDELEWNDITFVTLKIDEENWIEGSGSLNPQDGLAIIYSENGVRYIGNEAPESLGIIFSLLSSYLAGDNKWKNMILWELLE